MSRAETVNPDAAVTTIAGLPFPPYRRGKVRDVFDLGDRLLIVATDRLSAFDVVLPTAIPGKGALLTAISDFWFDHTEHLLPNHRTRQSLDDLAVSLEQQAMLADRSTIVRKAERIDIECVVRGHLAGSGWREYRSLDTLAGEALPPGLQRGDQLPDLRFTPAVKNDHGHDENISRARLAALIGSELATLLERTSIELFTSARSTAGEAGFVLADTKFELGFIDGELTLIDEALTPDSSRYWDFGTWRTGSEPPSFDKQAVRDWLESSGWNKEPPGPELPADIVTSTRDKYVEVLRRLSAIEQKEQG
ncbi:MAG: phosphoribosylaminoimidazolesuccinocarboxamide synthase [Thermomicrobiales bacterium]